MEYVRISCKRCGDSGFVIKDGSNHKSGICPNCELKEFLGLDDARIISVKFKKKKEAERE